MVTNASLFLSAVLILCSRSGQSAEKVSADSVCNQEIGRALMTISKENPLSLTGAGEKINMAKTYSDVAEGDIRSSQNLGSEQFTVAWSGKGKDLKYLLTYNPGVCSNLKQPAKLADLKRTIDDSILKNRKTVQSN